MKEIKSAADFQALANQNKPVLLDFYADWCGPCQALLPTVEKLAKQYEDDVEIVKVNVDNNRELAQKFGVRSIPALFFVQNGAIEERLVGLQTYSILNNKIKSRLTLTL